VTLERTIDILATRIHSVINNGTGEKEGPLQRRYGMVTAINTGVTPKLATITIAGNSISDIPCLKQYTPTVGDKALILQEGFDMIAIGCL
jgi:hypothetical protein